MRIIMTTFSRKGEGERKSAPCYAAGNELTLDDYEKSRIEHNVDQQIDDYIQPSHPSVNNHDQDSGIHRKGDPQANV
ncbi:hypothetical protein JMJ77_0014511 [Colletotrichum scovillei]|uniref:Uncharacterized protein n=1 Tax=Colletotrichum scovillei TaxID=1209932 RepID=A0A9P7R5K1_9PEZI|nr:hypothetical protein JMJ77_0014511 [Colletotrichum scovillei]KAG7066075.1 hypothetical protein JMJ78_0012812 [Colletotrichum scovillei]KAG7068647.1 hypothetical protein JMJ76_0008328 [Colletotrichum scovillei]